MKRQAGEEGEGVVGGSWDQQIRLWSPAGDGGLADTAGSSQQSACTSSGTTLDVRGLATGARQRGAAMNFCFPPHLM